MERFRYLFPSLRSKHFRLSSVRLVRALSVDVNGPSVISLHCLFLAWLSSGRGLWATSETASAILLFVIMPCSYDIKVTSLKCLTLKTGLQPFEFRFYAA